MTILPTDPAEAVGLMDQFFALFVEYDSTMASDIGQWFGSQEYPPRHAFRAGFRTDGKVWSVVADCGDRGTAISDGPTLDAARGRLREAIALLLDAPEDSFDLIEELVRDAGRGE